MDQLQALPDELRSRYRVSKVLGEGGFARVYLAEDLTLGRDVAIKLFLPHGDEDPEMLTREAKLLATMRHPNIATVYDAGLIAGSNIPYMVMEHLSGGSLRDRLAPGAPTLRQQDAIGLVAVLAEALEAAHEKNILHLDIKPENILFDQSGRPILADFGIGRDMGHDGHTRQTRAMGSGQYASPEQRQGGNLTKSSDIYSLGVVLFELLTGQLPLGPAAVHPQPPYSPPFQMNHPLVSATELVRLLCKALSVSPAFRYESAEDFAQDLRDYILQSGGATGQLGVRPGGRPFAASSITRVQIREPEGNLRLAETRASPRTVREMENDLPAVTPHSRVENLLYSHQALEIGAGSLVTQPVFARGLVRLRQDAAIRGDVISLTLIDVSQGVQAHNLLAPELMLRGPIRLEGSLFCRRLRPSEEGVHLPANSELGGSLILGKPFETIIGSDEIGRPLNVARQPIEIFHARPLIRVGTGCTLVAILGEADVEIDPRQKQLNTIRVIGDVKIGPSSQIRRVEGENVTIGPGCTIDEVHARGVLTIGRGSEVGYARAGQGIRLSHQVTISSPILFADNGAIHEESEAIWRVNGRTIDLTAHHLFDYSTGEGHGSIATVLLDHRLHELYDELSPGWLPMLSPSRFEGSADRVRQGARAKAVTDEEPEAPPLDLTPAAVRLQRQRELEAPVDAPEAPAPTTLFDEPDEPADEPRPPDTLPDEPMGERPDGPVEEEPPDEEPLDEPFLLDGPEESPEPDAFGFAPETEEEFAPDDDDGPPPPPLERGPRASFGSAWRRGTPPPPPLKPSDEGSGDAPTRRLSDFLGGRGEDADG